MAPLVLVHDVWHSPIHLRGLRARLAEAGWRVYVPALPGHGPGAAWGRWPGAAVDTVVAAVGRHAGPVTVVGHGWGAAVACAAAGRVPGRVARVVCVGGVLPTVGARSLWDETAPWMRLVLAAGRDGDVVAPPDVGSWWRWWVSDRVAGRHAGVPSDLVRRLHVTLVPAPLSALTGRLDLGAFYAAVRAGVVRVSYVRMTGSHAFGACWRWREFAGAAGVTDVRDVPGGHERPVTHPALVARAVHAAAAGLTPWHGRARAG